MDKKQLFNIINSILEPIGFKKYKQGVWRRYGSEVSECIYLQRSAYGRMYYFQCGCIINDLPLAPGMHYHTFGDFDIPIPINRHLQVLLDLENQIGDGERETKLKVCLEQVVPKSAIIDTEAELKAYLLKKQLAISRKVMDYLKIGWALGKYRDTIRQ